MSHAPTHARTSLSLPPTTTMSSPSRLRPPSSRAALGLSPGLPYSWLLLLITAALFVLAFAPEPAHAYIPAQATNNTAVAQAAGVNFTDTSKLLLQWYPMGSNEEQVSYQLVGAESLGISKGALVHFSEDKMPNDTTTTPWIALVSCDANSTNASMDEDIFTLAQDRGAIAALLYSLTSVTCFINPQYSNPAYFDQVMDIFATTSLITSKIIESEFNSVLGNSSQSKYYWFSPSLLNDSATDIHTAVANGTVPEAGYLFATLTAFNATDSSTNTTGTGSTTSSGQSGPSQPSGTNTSLAMIILYAITGCVSALFCIVIISGAIRAIRHPERYGPRSGDAFGPPGTLGPQSRAGGLTRAILDTFPVVKFGRTEPAASGPSARKDIESADDGTIPHATASAKAAEVDDRSEVAVELREWTAVSSRLDGAQEDRTNDTRAVPVSVPAADDADEQEDPSSRASSSSAPVPRPPHVLPRPSKASGSRAGAQAEERDVVPDAIGRETCPICIVDFEEGDDLRVLPCEGHHRFHQECVDQWLLELSSSCPLCRQDFQALQTMMTAGEEGDHNMEPPHAPGSSARPISSAAARFSKYLRTARGRRQRRGGEGQAGYDATNPPMPFAPHTTLQM